MEKFIAYYRVSTRKQGKSGLGMQAQKSCVLNRVGNGEILAEFIEEESGKNNDRPQLLKALEASKRTGAKLIIAKLDRLARNASFIFRLRDSGVDFIACDIPEANTMTIGIMALLAQQERELISARTKAALTAKKKQLEKVGEKLGTPANLTQEARKKGGMARKQQARNNSANKRASALIMALRKVGLSYQKIANQLNENGYKSSRGNAFSPKAVEILYKRI